MTDKLKVTEVADGRFLLFLRENNATKTSSFQTRSRLVLARYEQKEQEKIM
jgi:hypothetical protein